MKILITGGRGYLAKALYDSLSRKYQVTIITRDDFDLTDFSSASNWFSDKFFDVVIHTAITGGSRLQQDDISVLDTNLKMYYNLLNNRSHFHRFINIGSGAELYLSDTPYGLSKRIIMKSIFEKDNFYNVRVFAVFDENEQSSRFIKGNLERYIKKKPMMLHYNKVMDFFYMQDFIKVIEYYINTLNPPKEFDCTYEHSISLNELADVINNLADYKVDIRIESLAKVQDYKGVYTNLGIHYVGLFSGIKQVYDNLLCEI